MKKSIDTYTIFKGIVRRITLECQGDRFIDICLNGVYKRT